MENQKFIRHVYNLIRRPINNIDWKGQFPTPDEILNDKGNDIFRYGISEKDLPKELNFSELPDILKELKDYGLIEFNGKLESKKDSDNPKNRIPAYWACLLQLVDIDEFLKKKGVVNEKWFFSNNNSINFNGVTYTPTNEAQGKFIKQLVINHRKQNKNRDITRDGKRLQEIIMLNETGVTSDKLKTIIKQLNKAFKEKNFPIKIDKNSDGVLLIYTE